MKSIVPALLLCCLIIEACAMFERLDEESIFRRNSPEEGSAETATPVSSSESGHASLYRDAPEDDEEESGNESEASSEVYPSTDDDDDLNHDQGRDATDDDEDHEDDEDEDYKDDED